MRDIEIGLVEYPGVMASAILGLADMFHFANRIGNKIMHTTLPAFSLSRWRLGGQRMVPEIPKNRWRTEAPPFLDVVIIPPGITDAYYEVPHHGLVDWLRARHSEGTIMCSACAGAFILAETGLLDGRQVTTHWDFASRFAQRFPKVQIDIDQLLINDGDIITTGGLMSWLDLGLELVAQFKQPSVMIELGKYLVIDTGRREQRYYKKFVPHLGHGNAAIVKAQHYIQQNFHVDLTVKALAAHCYLGERTLLRQFLGATGFTPLEYIQNVRVQKARELIETNNLPVEIIAAQVGYDDAGAFRKIFKRLTGLSPREFRVRFSVSPGSK